MAWEQLSFGTKLLTIGKWAGLISLILTAVISVGVLLINAIFFDAGWMPVVDATFGKIIASDNDIGYAVQQIVANPSLPSLYVNTLKESIIYSLSFIVLMHYLLFLGISKLFKAGNSIDLSFINLVLIMFIVILILIASQLVYNGIMRDSWDWIPYRGVASLVQNYQIWGITGNTEWNLSDGVPAMLNQSVQNA